jgi:hypothetical protein
MDRMMRLIVVLTLPLLVVAHADPVPVPESFGETVVTPAPAKYSWEAGLLGNLVPGLGYFLIEEPVWGLVEIGLVGGGITLLIVGSNMTGLLSGIGETVVGGCLAGAAYLGGLIHAPLLAEYKNERLEYSLFLSPGMGVAGDGECYPTLNLTLRF